MSPFFPTKDAQIKDPLGETALKVGNATRTSIFPNTPSLPKVFPPSRNPHSAVEPTFLLVARRKKEQNLSQALPGGSPKTADSPLPPPLPFAASTGEISGIVSAEKKKKKSATQSGGEGKGAAEIQNTF